MSRILGVVGVNGRGCFHVGGGVAARVCLPILSAGNTPLSSSLGVRGGTGPCHVQASKPFNFFFSVRYGQCSNDNTVPKRKHSDERTGCLSNSFKYFA